MKYVARPREFRRPEMHTIGHIVDGELVRGDPMSLPDFVEIELEPGKECCMMYRYTNAGEFCGDTWHEDLDSAFAQAEYEYGLTASDFLHVQSLGAPGGNGAA